MTQRVRFSDTVLLKLAREKTNYYKSYIFSAVFFQKSKLNQTVVLSNLLFSRMCNWCNMVTVMHAVGMRQRGHAPGHKVWQTNL